MSAADETLNRMQLAWKRLGDEWRQTSTGWNDAARQQFTKQHWAQIAEGTDTYVQELITITEVIAQARRSVR